MKLIYQLIAAVLIASGMFAMFSSSMVGAGVSGYIGVPLFAVGLFFAVLPLLGRRNGNAGN